jgi:3-oxoacyl-[acyl-carrier protein] reductase
MFGPLLTTQEAGKLIGPEGGSIINISISSSLVGQMPAPTGPLWTRGDFTSVTSLNPGMVEMEGLHCC